MWRAKSRRCKLIVLFVSPRLRVTGEKSLQENRSSEDTQDEKIAPLSVCMFLFYSLDTLSVETIST